MRARIAREELGHIRALTRQADELERELLELIRAYRPALLDEQGCGALTAATVDRPHRRRGAVPLRCLLRPPVGQRTDPVFLGAARSSTGSIAAGTASSTGRCTSIAITRAQRDPATKEYLARKEAEGKTKKGALRCLKRYLARRFYRLLSEPPLPAERPIRGEQVPEPAQPLDASAVDASRDTSRSVQPTAIPERPARKPQTQRINAAPNPMICIA